MKQGPLWNHLPFAPNPRSTAFFLHFQELKAGWQTALGIHGATRCLTSETSLCQGDLCGAEVIVESWKRQVLSLVDDVGVSESDEVGLKV